MRGWLISDYIPDPDNEVSFEKLLKIFQELLSQTGGNVEEALSWLTQLDNMYRLTDDNYTLSDFVDELKEKGFLSEKSWGTGNFRLTSKMNINIRKQAFEDIFGEIIRSQSGRHTTKISGKGDDYSSDLKGYEFGDRIENIALSESLKNA